MSELLENHIDEPIKKCVAGMALLGFKPMMSCCGFSYKDEKVQKKHLQKAYIYLDYKHLMENMKAGHLFHLANISRWKMDILNGGQFLDFYCDTWSAKHPWADVNCPHFYEPFILGISALEKSIISLKQYFIPTATVEDGNKFYKENVSKYWQYEPTESWIVTPEIFEKL